MSRLEDTVDTESDDDDVETIPRVPRNGAAAKGTKLDAKKDPKPGAKKAAKGTVSQKESERKKRELIAIGKAKGFLTYAEVSAHMPEGIVAPDQMDEWLAALADEGIEIVEPTSKPRPSRRALARPRLKTTKKLKPRSRPRPTPRSRSRSRPRRGRR